MMLVRMLLGSIDSDSGGKGELGNNGLDQLFIVEAQTGTIGG